jgi:hypothetical protein
MMVGFR